MEDFKTYLQEQNKSSITIKEYKRQVNLFLQWFGSDAMNYHKKDVLNYLSYLKETKKVQAITRNNGLIALRHYFDFLVREELIPKNPTALIKLRGLNKRRLHYIFNLEELEELADTFYQLQVKQAQEKATTSTRKTLYQNSYYAQYRNYTMLLFMIYQGLKTREILELKTQHIELHKATLYVPKGTQRGNERKIPLHATQIGAIIQYLNEIRPQLAQNDTDTFFLPSNQAQAKKLSHLTYLSNALKKNNPNYKTIAQLRASVITYWIQTYGLRKAQYLAGHKSIVSTEEYIPNNIEDLADDITKFNPF